MVRKVLTDLSEDEITNIFMFCDRNSLLALGSTCKVCHRISQKDLLWKPILSEKEQEIIKRTKKPTDSSTVNIKKLLALYRKTESNRLSSIGMAMFLFMEILCSCALLTVVISVLGQFLPHQGYWWWISYTPVWITVLCFGCFSCYHTVCALKYRGLFKLSFDMVKESQEGESIKYEILGLNSIVVILTTQCHLHTLWIVYLMVAIGIKLFFWNAAQGMWMLTLTPVAIPMLLSIIIFIIGVITHLRMILKKQWSHEDERIGITSLCVTYVSCLILATMLYLFIYVQVCLVAAKLDKLISVSWHIVLLPSYILSGILLCGIPFCLPTVFQAYYCFKPNAQMVDIFVSFIMGEIVKWFLEGIACCIFAPQVVFVVLLGLKLDGLGFGWYIVFIPQWIAFLLCCGCMLCLIKLGQ